MPELIQLIQDLGGTLGALGASFWYIKYQSDAHRTREELWMSKDSENDSAMRELMRDSNSQLMAVMRDTNTILKEMTVALHELKETIHKDNSK